MADALVTVHSPYTVFGANRTIAVCARGDNESSACGQLATSFKNGQGQRRDSSLTSRKRVLPAQ